MLKASYSAFKKYHAYLLTLEPKELACRAWANTIVYLGIFILSVVFVILAVRADPELKMIIMGG